MEQTIFPGGLNVKNMKIWVDGLLSDEFEQGQGRLAFCDRDFTGKRGPKKLCCLGVASELAIRHGVDVHVSEDTSRVRVGYIYNGQRDFLGYEVMCWLGMDSENPQLIITLSDGTPVMRSASSLNDGEAEDGYDQKGMKKYLPRYSFRDIALALIRTYNLPGYDHLLEEADAQADQ